MPTKRFRKSETFIEKRKQGSFHDPLPIKMCYNVGKEQKLNLGIDTGTSNIGVSLQQRR